LTECSGAPALANTSPDKATTVCHRGTGGQGRRTDRRRWRGTGRSAILRDGSAGQCEPPIL